MKVTLPNYKLSKSNIVLIYITNVTQLVCEMKCLSHVSHVMLFHHGTGDTVRVTTPHVFDHNYLSLSDVPQSRLLFGVKACEGVRLEMRTEGILTATIMIGELGNRMTSIYHGPSEELVVRASSYDIVDCYIAKHFWASYYS